MPSGLVRSSPFSSSAAPSPKRRKISQPKGSGDDSSDDAFSSEVATLPLNSSYFNKIAAAAPALRSSPVSQTTQPTQILDPSRTPVADRSVPPIIQVAASSPPGNSQPSPNRPQLPPKQQSTALRTDGSVRPFDFYPSKANGRAIDLTGDPQYIGGSSDEASDHDIKPTFVKTGLAGRTVPLVTSTRDRKDNVVSLVEVSKVEESPINIRGMLSKFTYSGPSSRPPIPFRGRLDSVTRKPVTTTYASGNGGSRLRTQREINLAQPIVDITIEDIENQEYRNCVQRMKEVLPGKSVIVLLNALLEKKGNYDDAMSLLTEEESVVDLTATGDEKASGRRKKGVAPVKTSNRAAVAPRKAIRDKWSSTQGQTIPLSSSPPIVEKKARRRLVKASARNSIERSSSPPVVIVYDDDTDSAAQSDDDSDERELESRVLNYVNSCTTKELADIACTTEEIAEVILSQKPFSSLHEVRAVSSDINITAKGKKGKGGSRTRAIGDKVIDVCLETWRGYEAVDSLIAKVEELGKPIAESIKKWGVDIFGGVGASSGELDMTDINIDSGTGFLRDSAIGTPTDSTGNSDIVMAEDGDGEIKSSRRENQIGQFFKQQPKNLGEGVILKDYQVVGVNWLSLLYEKKLSCILADEMGLGKTCQVIAFLARLMEKGIQGPHLVVVPSSTLENWLREFSNFCPALTVEPYYGSQKDRAEMRMDLSRRKGWNVLVTTYQLATGDKLDKKFLKDQAFNVCVYDEGHLLKNSASNRYDALMRLPAVFRLLLTGTPLQNNLQELASLLAFILPSVFNEKREELASIFKYKAKTTDDEESNSALLSVQRIKRARAMMTPFVLRRKKQQVLKHLPAKTNRVEYCDMNDVQSAIYYEHISTAAKALEEQAAGKKASKSTTNLMMQLRKAAIHPLLFRRYYDNARIDRMSTAILKEDFYKTHERKYILEDMEVMNDLELNRLCTNFQDTLSEHELKKKEWMGSGKVEKLKHLLLRMKANGDRVLLFSQFTQVLDILELVLTTLNFDFLRIDGATPVDARQDLIDQFHEEEDITVFLLSTKAGGFGINLACANKVIIFDSSFNPHDDAQASDRAHRVGQVREVEVIRLVTRNTIEEQILALANTKLALDQSISESDDKAIEGRAEQLVAKMLLQTDPTLAPKSKSEAELTE